MAMIINPPNHFVVFDGQNLADWGVRISGADSFGSPDRDTKNVDIPGRDGGLTQDNGRFKNYTLKYEASILGEDEEDFRLKLDKLRSWLSSKYSYRRLEDTYHREEYRLAKWVGGLDPKVVMLQGGTFTLEFDCKPQRFLKDGEKVIPVTSNTSFINPTDYYAKPLVKVNFTDNGFAGVTYKTVNPADYSSYTVPSNLINGTSYYAWRNSDSTLSILAEDGLWTLPANRSVDDVQIAALQNAYSSLTYYRDELKSWKDYMSQTVKDILGQFTVIVNKYSKSNHDFDEENMTVANLLEGTDTYYYFRNSNKQRVIVSENTEYILPEGITVTRDQVAMACISIKAEIVKAKDQLQTTKDTILNNAMEEYSAERSAYKADDLDFNASNLTSDNQIGSTKFYYFKTMNFEEVDTYIDPTSSDEDKAKKQEEIRHKQEEVEKKRNYVVVSTEYNRKWKIPLGRTDITKDTFVTALTDFEKRAANLDTKYATEYDLIGKRNLGTLSTNSIEVTDLNPNTDSDYAGSHKIEDTDDFYLNDPQSESKHITVFWNDQNVPLKFTLPLKSYINGSSGNFEYILSDKLFDAMDELKAVRTKYKETYASYYNKLMTKALTRYGEFSIDDEIIVITQSPKSVASNITSIYIDSDMMDCYYDGMNCNDLVRFARNTFPNLKPGMNNITLGTGINSIEIIPRWYTI